MAHFLICPVDMYENNRKVTSTAAAVSYMHVSLWCERTVTGDSGSIIGNANYWGTTTGQFGIKNITHWLSVAL